MLVIRREQMAVFDALTRRRLENLLVPTMTETWPAVAEKLGPDGVRARIRLGLEKSERHGFVDSNQTTRFVHLMFLLDEHFDSRPWAVTILGWKLAEDRKLDSLERRAQQHAAAPSKS